MNDIVHISEISELIEFEDSCAYCAVGRILTALTGLEDSVTAASIPLPQKYNHKCGFLQLGL